jgi:TonB family protein
MRAAEFAFVAVTAGSVALAALAACGGSGPTPQAPNAATVTAPVADPAVSVGSGDAGPTSTTTQTLGSVGGASGTKLTPLGGESGADAGHSKPRGELGRGASDIQAIIASHRDEARACYDSALAAHPGIEGTIDVRWTIDPTGTVKDAEVDTSHSELVEPSVASCVIAIVKKIHFNASAKGFETKTHYPFNFHPHTRHSVMGNGNP